MNNSINFLTNVFIVDTDKNNENIGNYLNTGETSFFSINTREYLKGIDFAKLLEDIKVYLINLTVSYIYTPGKIRKSENIIIKLIYEYGKYKSQGKDNFTFDDLFKTITSKPKLAKWILPTLKEEIKENEAIILRKETKHIIEALESTKKEILSKGLILK